MNRQTLQTSLIFTLLILLLAACGRSKVNEPIASAPKSGSGPAGEIAPARPSDTESPVEPAATYVPSAPVVESKTEDTADYVTEAESPAEISSEESAAQAPLSVAPAPLATAPPPAAGIIAPEPIYPTPAPQRPSNTFFEDYGVNPFILTQVDPLSTFSLDVDTGSYSVARNYLRQGLQPPPEAIRPEEFVNAFDQGYDIPPDTAFAVYADGAPSPFHNDGTYFLRIGVQGYEMDERERPPANLTFVIDVSGSMAQENRLGLVKQSLQMLVDRMRADDSIAIVVYGSSARVVLPPTSGANRNVILNAIYSLQPEGSTNLEAGLLLGYQQANIAYKPGGINRVILASDGVANVGLTDPDGIASQIRGYADAGIQLTTLGFGLGNYNDVMMEQLADQGDGQYAYIDTVQEARELFVDNLMSTLQTIALDAKIQVEFDPNVVQQYRLIGYENRAIADQDFRNNEVDAAEFGAGHTATAIYAIQFVPGAQGRIATVRLRWQDPDSRAVQEIEGVFTTDDLARSFDEAPLRYQLAVVVSQYAELLRNSYWTTGVSMNDVQIYLNRLAAQLGDPEVQELANLAMLSR